MRRLSFADRSDILKDFMAHLDEDIPECYLKFMKTEYGLDPHRLIESGARYLGGNWERAKASVVQDHGSDVLLKAGLFFKANRGDRTYMRFEPSMWKKTPLIVIPATSEGFIDHLVGVAPVTDDELYQRDTVRWFQTKTKNSTGPNSLIGLRRPVADGVVTLSADVLSMMRLRGAGYEALCVPGFKKFLGSWIKKLGDCRVYISRSDAEAYADELTPIFELFSMQERDIFLADFNYSGDYMEDLRSEVGLPALTPTPAEQVSVAPHSRSPRRKVSPYKDRGVLPEPSPYVQGSLL